MKAQELWEEFVRTKSALVLYGYGGKIGEYPGDEVSFGGDKETRDSLVQLIADGVKTATSSALSAYQMAQEPLPVVGGYSAVVDGSGEARCIIWTTKVWITSFSQVTEEHAWKEGEGDKTLSYWRKAHREFFTQDLKRCHLEFEEEMKVVCEEFQVVYLPSAECRHSSEKGSGR